jgi:hypothetical protein
MEAVLHVDTGEWKSEIPLIEDWFATIGPKLPIEIDLEFEKLRAKVLAQSALGSSAHSLTPRQSGSPMP